MFKYVDGIEFVTIECCSCGIPFAMTDEFNQRKLDKRNVKNENRFFCPNGHGQSYTGKTDSQKLRERLQETQSKLEAESGRAHILEHQKNELSTTYRKMRDRVKSGVCPCCNRSFQNLMNHMKSKHPEFGSHQILKSVRETYGLTQCALAEEIGIRSSYVSLYERQKKLPASAATDIESWMKENA